MHAHRTEKSNCIRKNFNVSSLSYLFIEPTTFNYQGSLSICFLIWGFACLLPSFKLLMKLEAFNKQQ